MSVYVIETHHMPPNDLEDALKFCGCASKIEAYKVGWIPLAAYRGATLQRRLLVCFNNGEKVGFCLWQFSYGDMAIYQIWVRPDARLILHGKAIVTKLNELGEERNARLIRLWCAEDLAANMFWAALGFENKGWRHGPKRTSKRKHLLWTQRIVATIFAEEPDQAPSLNTADYSASRPLYLSGPEPLLMLAPPKKTEILAGQQPED